MNPSFSNCVLSLAVLSASLMMNLLFVGFSLGYLHRLLSLHPLSASVTSNSIDGQLHLYPDLSLDEVLYQNLCLTCPPGCLAANSEIIIASSPFSVNIGNSTILQSAQCCHLFCLLHIHLPYPSLSDLCPL